MATHGSVRQDVSCLICGNVFDSVPAMASHHRFHDKEYTSSLVKTSRESRKSEDYKRRLSRSLKQYRANHPETLERDRKRMSNLWNDSEWKEMMVKKTGESHRTKEYVEKASELAKKQWKNPEIKKKMSESRHRTLSSNWTDDMKRFYDDPEFAKDLIVGFGYRPTCRQLQDRLGLHTSTVLRTIYRHCLQDYVDLKYTHSKDEIDLRDHIIEYSGRTVHPDRSVLGRYELDMLVDGTDIAVEYDGCYWHSIVSSDYHLMKTRMCEERGVRLVHVFEDEYVLDPDAIRSYIYMLIDDSFSENDLLSSIAVESIDGDQIVIDRSKSSGAEFSRFGWDVVDEIEPRPFYVLRDGLVRSRSIDNVSKSSFFTIYDCGALVLKKS